MGVARHTIYNIGGASIPLLLSLVTLPLYFSVIGLERYGVLSICWLFLGYFSLFDFGLGRATAQRLAITEDPTLRGSIFWTSLGLSAVLAALTLILFVPLTRIALRLLDFQTGAVAAEIDQALPWLAAALPLGMLGSVFMGALEGRRNFATLNALFVASTVLTSVAPLAAAIVLDPRLPTLLAASFAGRTAGVALLLIACVRGVPARRPQLPKAKHAYLLLSYGGWTLISNVVSPLLSMWDRFAIGAVIGAAAVSLYVVPSSLVAQLLVVPAALGSALFPRLAAAGAEEVGGLAREGLDLLLFFLTPLTIVVAALAEPFLRLWLGSATGTAAAPVASLLLPGLWANSLARIPAAQLQARGRPDLMAKLHLSELLPYVGCLMVALHAFGVAGAAVAWSLRSSADALGLFLLSGVRMKSLARLAPHAVLILAAVASAIARPPESTLRWLLLAVILMLAAWMVLRNSPARISHIAGELAKLTRGVREVR